MISPRHCSKNLVPFQCIIFYDKCMWYLNLNLHWQISQLYGFSFVLIITCCFSWLGLNASKALFLDETLCHKKHNKHLLKCSLQCCQIPFQRKFQELLLLQGEVAHQKHHPLFPGHLMLFGQVEVRLLNFSVICVIPTTQDFMTISSLQNWLTFLNSSLHCIKTRRGILY